jgi:mannitol/fructose-specific phosphotransferase system IIA component (Ntr-type)
VGDVGRNHRMLLTDVLGPEVVKMELKARTRDEAIRELVELLAEAGGLRKGDVESMTAAILKRESLGSTAIGRGVAIPHAKAPTAQEFVAALGRSTRGIDFASIDGKPVNLVFLLASPPDSQRAHLKALAHISRLVSKDDLCGRILAAKDAKDVLGIIAEEENGK